RSTQEFLFVGHPLGAAHIPYIDEPDWIPNPCFTNQVRALLPVVAEVGVKREDPILLICRSGERSKAAGEVLLEDGVNNVFSIIDGFEGPLDKYDHRSGISGWRYDGLPWAQC
ncbi:MAG TPA: sulfurtransferase, partial [Gammaproteobacteria bacterium]|nr:sulfurtransferase [Gammaproteobacteria bacterium]